MTQYEIEATKNLIKGMTDDEIECVKEALKERVIQGRKECDLKSTRYDVTLNIKVMYDFEGFENLKSDREYAESLAEFIADEITTANGIAQIDIIKSSMNVH